MGLIDIAKLTEDVTTKSNNLDGFFLYIHILGYISGFSNKSVSFFSSNDRPIVSGIAFDNDTLKIIKESFANQHKLSALTDDERKNKLCKHYYDKCLHFEKYITKPPKKSANFSDKSKRSDLDWKWEIDNYLYNKQPLISQYIKETFVKFIKPKNGQTIYSPNCSNGSLFVALNKTFSGKTSIGYNKELKYRGSVNNQIELFLCIINLYINGILDEKKSNIEIEVSSSFQDISKTFNKSKVEHNNAEEIADIAVSVVPSTNLRDKLNPNYFPLSHNLETTEYPYIELMLNVTNEQEGKAIAIVPDSILYSRKGKDIRRAYLSKDWIEKVVSLSDKTLGRSHNSVKTSLIVFNKNKVKKNFVFFDGDDEEFEKVERENHLIISKNDTNLNPYLYALKESKELRKILADAKNRATKIGGSVDEVRLGQNYSPRGRIVKNSLETLPYVRVSDLATNEHEFDLDVNKIERKISTEIVNKPTIIDFSAVLVSRIAPKLKPTYFNFANQPIVIGSDIMALKLRDSVNVEYFLTQLYSRLVQIQVKMMSSGTTIQRITKDNFLNLQIVLPPLEEQKKLAIEFLKKTQKELIVDVAEVEKEVKNAEYDTISIAMHDFNKPLGAMQHDLSALKGFFDKKLRDYLEEPIKPIFDDDTEEQVDQFRLGKVLQRLIDTRNEASAQLEKTRDELQNNDVTPIRIRNLKKWFEQEIKPLYRNEVEVEVSGEKVQVEIDTKRFKNLVRNLVVNAQDNNAQTICFDVSYTYIDGEKKVRILYKNDGDPFSEDFDFEIHFKGLYQKSNSSSGTGIGGYSVNKTVELHNGEMKDVSPKNKLADSFSVQIEIILPIDYKPNPNYVKSNPRNID